MMTQNKTDLIEEIKNTLPWYTEKYGGKTHEVVILDNYETYNLDELKEDMLENILNGTEEVQYAIEGTENGAEITYEGIKNPNNQQKKIWEYVEVEDVDFYRAQIELTLTNDFFDYHNTIADNVLYSTEDSNEDSLAEIVQVYNEHVDMYNKYGDLQKIEDIKNIDNVINVVLRNDQRI